MDWEAVCKQLQKRVTELEQENQELRRKLGYSEQVQSAMLESLKTEMMPETFAGAGVYMRSTPEEKIRLFHSLFRGRKDVFARRWYSVQKEKGGYAPVCANEWKYGVCMQVDEDRNNMIVEDVLAAVAEGRTPIVLTERYDHAKLLADILREKSKNVVLLSGKGTAKEKREILQGLSQIPSDEPLTLVATGRYVGEGFDLPRLDTLFLAMPVSWKGTLAQYAGRLHRNYEGKQEVLIYDYVDIRVPMLERMYHKRLSGYVAIGYTVRGDKTAPASENRIFSQEEYWDTFSADISNAQKEILVTSPYLHIAQVKRFLKLLPKVVHLTVVTGDESSFKPEAWEKMSNAAKVLETVGATVILHPKVYQRYAVIDKNILWYGGINFLGFEKTVHGAMRLCSAELAKELLNRSETASDAQIKLAEA